MNKIQNFTGDIESLRCTVYILSRHTEHHTLRFWDGAIGAVTYFLTFLT